MNIIQCFYCQCQIYNVTSLRLSQNNMTVGVHQFLYVNYFFLKPDKFRTVDIFRSTDKMMVMGPLNFKETINHIFS